MYWQCPARTANDTSAMLAKILDHARLEPGFLIVGVPLLLTLGFNWRGRHFVIEAMIRHAFVDKRSSSDYARDADLTSWNSTTPISLPILPQSKRSVIIGRTLGSRALVANAGQRGYRRVCSVVRSERRLGEIGTGGSTRDTIDVTAVSSRREAAAAVACTITG